MSLIDGLLHRLRVLARGERYAREQADEFEFHLDLDTRAQQTSANEPGSSDAQRVARRNFGNTTYYREEARRMSALNWLDRLEQDVRYALRGLRRQPGFTTMVVVTLALGFGVNAAMFSLLNRLFLHYPDGVVAPEQVRRFYNTVHLAGGPSGGVRTTVFDRYEYPHFRTMRSSLPGHELALTTEPDSITIRGGAREFASRQTEVSRAYFSVLGLKPAIGRFFVADEDSIASPTPVAIISEYLWRTKFGRAPDVIGASVTIDNRPFTIVGVAPADFRGIDLDAIDVWVPLNTAGSGANEGRPWYDQFGLAARLIARVRSPADEAVLATLAQNAMQTTQIAGYQFDPNETVSTGSLVAARGPAEPAKETAVLTRISAVALLVLIIAVANIVNLLLLRAANRRREISLRRALGVSAGRLLSQLIVEGVLLSLIAGVVAVAIAWWSGTVLRELAMPATHWATPPIDLATVSFILSLSLIIGIVSAIAPMLNGVGVPVAEVLKTGTAGDSHSRSAARTTLLIVQTALCVVLVVGAGLFAKSLANVMSIDTGYDIANVVLVSPNFPPKSGNHVAEAARVMRDLAERVTANPAVAAVGYAQVDPMRGMRFQAVHLPGGEALPKLPNDIGPSLNIVSSTFFDATGMRILRGRGFTTSDAPSAPPVVIVNATWAKTVWPNADPIGKCLILGNAQSGNTQCTTVIGVVSDANRRGLIESRSMVYYLPATQPIDTLYPILRLIVRARPEQTRRAALVASQAVRTAFPNADGVQVRTMYSLVEREARPWQIGATLFTAFGFLAFIVAGVGVYSVVAYGVAQRTHELGIRIALGATRAQITDLVIGSGLRSVGVGVALGLIASWMLAPLVRSLLFGVTTDDASTYIAAATALCILGMLASVIPAMRAARVDPVVALRSE